MKDILKTRLAIPLFNSLFILFSFRCFFTFSNVWHYWNKLWCHNSNGNHL